MGNRVATQVPLRPEEEQYLKSQLLAGGQDVPRGTMTPVNFDTVAKQLNQRELESLKQQGLTVEGLKKELENVRKSDMPVDLTPAAALVDAWTGSNFAKSYQPVETRKDRQATINQLQKAIQQGEGGLAENEIAILRNQLNMQFQKDNLDWKKKQDALNQANKVAITPEEGFNIRTKLAATDSAKQARGINGFLDALNEYEGVVNKYGITPTGEGASKLNSAYAKMSTRFKEAENLGALSGPDLNILRQNVANAGGWDSYIQSQMKGGVAGVKSSIAQTRKGAQADFGRSMSDLEGMAAGVGDAAKPVLDSYRSQYAKTLERSKGSEGPNVGDVVNGYVFKGGDPADQANWEVQK